MKFLSGKEIVQNIYTIAKMKNIKIADIEKYSEISSGYLSRILKSDKNIYIGTDTLVKIADKLEVNCDFLISYDLTNKSTNQLEALNFIETLHSKTLKSEVIWGVLSTENLEDNGHILYKRNLSYDGYNKRYLFNSLFLPSELSDKITTSSAIFYITIDKIKFYLVEHSFDKLTRGDYELYELYYEENHKIKPFCCSNPFESYILNEPLKKLFETIRVNYHTPNLSKKVFELIKNFK